MVDVELRTSYAAGDDWGAFDIAFWGENCMDYAVLKKYPPVAMPPELYVYGNTVSGVPGAVARLLKGLFPDTIIQSTTYGTVNKLLQH